jgi:D-glycero-alpha-D-manno-heptose-7-phosphate kinase
MRVSFVGGGTDLESYYNQGRPGHVVSAAIDLYSYVAIKDMFDSNTRVHHSEIETETITSRIKHLYARTALEYYGIFKGAEVVLTSDVMVTGSGLGASSSMMSALITGCNEIRGKEKISKQKLAELTYKLEHSSGTVGGKQDQYATVFGGVNSIKFSNNKVEVKPVKISKERIKEFESRLFLVFTNLARESKNIQLNLKESIEGNRKVHLDDLRNLSYEFLDTLESGNSNINRLGKLLNKGWELKKSSNRHTTNPYIEQLYDTLKTKGVIGGKILGAGGGGFFLAFAKDPKVKEKIKYELYPNFIAVDVKFSFKGTEILWKNF